MYLSVGLWIACFMPYLSHIFKELSVRSQRGAQESCFSYSLHDLLSHCKHPAYWQQKSALSIPFCQPMYEAYLGRKWKICRLKRHGPQELGTRQWGCAGAQRKPQATSWGCRTCRTGTFVFPELIQIHSCVITELDCPFPLFCLMHAPSTFDSSMLHGTTFWENPSCWLPL